MCSNNTHPSWTDHKTLPIRRSQWTWPSCLLLLRQAVQTCTYDAYTNKWAFRRERHWRTLQGTAPSHTIPDAFPLCKSVPWGRRNPKLQSLHPNCPSDLYRSARNAACQCDKLGRRWMCNTHSTPGLGKDCMQKHGTTLQQIWRFENNLNKYVKII